VRAGLRELRDAIERRFDPGQPRDNDGRWTDGMPGSIVSTQLRLTGGTATVDRRPGGNPRLTVGGRTVEMSTGDRRSELERFRSLAINAQYDDDSARGPDGAFRMSRLTTVDGRPQSDVLVSLRPVPGALVTEDGHRVGSYEEAPDGVEVYVAEFDLVLNEGADSDFDDEPSTRVSLRDIDPGSRGGIYETMLDAASAERVDGGLGPIDVFTPKPGRVGFRAKGDDGQPVEVEFNAKDFRKLDAAIDHVIDEGGSRTVDTAHGPVEVTFKGPTEGGYSDANTLLISPPSGSPWSFGATGSGIGDLANAINANGAAAGIIRSAQPEEAGGSADVARYSPEQPRIEAGSASGGQFAGAEGEGRKKSNGSETLGYDPRSNRGSGYGTAGGDARVKRLQEALNRLGLTDADGKPLKVDGKLGPKTTAAIKKAQRQLGVTPDGKVTPALLEKIAAMKGGKPKAKVTPRPAKAALKTKPTTRLTEKKSTGRLVARGEHDVYTYDRTFPLDDIQIQRSGDGRTVEAYAAMFDAPYEVRDEHGHYKEVIERAAFNRTLNGGAGRQAMCLYNHGRNLEGQPDSMASIPLGNPLEIRADGRGLLTVTRYNRGPYTDQVLEAIRNGDIKAQSFRGRIVRSSPNGRVPRSRYGAPLPTVTRHELGLTDYGPTPIPVNLGAEIVAVRSVQDLITELQELDADEREELLRSLNLEQSTHDGDPDDEEVDDEEDLDDETATPDGSGPGAEDPPAERSAAHSGRHQQELTRRIRVAKLTRSMR
jgi:HK97 family phage prohead protease